MNILNPGTGVGGHCIAVDPWFIVSGDPVNAKLIKQARLVNDTKPEWVVEKINRHLVMGFSVNKVRLNETEKRKALYKKQLIE